MESYKHDTGTYAGKGGVEIFFQKWVVEKARAVLIIVHGIGEHSGRYGNLLKALAGKNISVFALDHRGHGRSEGKRGHVDSFMDYVYDLKLFTEVVKDENRGLPVVLYGHSMGGAIATKYTMSFPDDVSMLVLSSPGFKTVEKIPDWKMNVAKFISSRMASFSTNTHLSADLISHDREYVKSYITDPLVHGKATARLMVEFFRAMEECLAGASNVKKTMLVFHGTGDKIVDYKAAEQFFNDASSPVKKLFLFEGLYHETINESPADSDRVLKDVVGWIISHLGSIAPVKQKPVAVEPASKKPASKKPQAKKPAVKKVAAKKSAAKKTASKKAAVKKVVAKKTASKKPAVKKVAAKKTAVKKANAKKAVKKKK